MGTQRVLMKGVLRFLGWFVGIVEPVQYKRFVSCLGALVGPVKNIFYLTIHYFNLFVLIAQHAGQAVVLGRLSLRTCICVSGYEQRDFLLRVPSMTVLVRSSCTYVTIYCTYMYFIAKKSYISIFRLYLPSFPTLDCSSFPI
jgi:hypothetical protein